MSNEKEKNELRKRGVEVTALDLGEFNLRGLEAPEHLFLVWLLKMPFFCCKHCHQLFPKQLEGRKTMTRSMQSQIPEMSRHIK